MPWDRPLLCLRTVHFQPFWTVHFDPRPSTIDWTPKSDKNCVENLQKWCWFGAKSKKQRNFCHLNCKKKITGIHPLLSILKILFQGLWHHIRIKQKGINGQYKWHCKYNMDGQKRTQSSGPVRTVLNFWIPDLRNQNGISEIRQKLICCATTRVSTWSHDQGWPLITKI